MAHSPVRTEGIAQQAERQLLLRLAATDLALRPVGRSDPGVLDEPDRPGRLAVAGPQEEILDVTEIPGLGEAAEERGEVADRIPDPCRRGANQDRAPLIETPPAQDEAEPGQESESEEEDRNMRRAVAHRPPPHVPPPAPGNEPLRTVGERIGG